MLSTSIGLNAVSAHGTCTAVFVAVAAVVSLLIASIRTLGKMTWLAWVGVVCVFVAGKKFSPFRRALSSFRSSLKQSFCQS